MGSRENKPNFQGVLDLGLRDVGVENDPRRLAAELGKTILRVLPPLFLSLFATCIVVALTGLGAWIIVPLMLAWTVGIFAAAWQTAKRMPVTVLKVSADGTNQAVGLMVAPFVLFALMALLIGDPVLIAPVVLGAISTVFVWRSRGDVPAVLRELRALLADGEKVLGDGIGRVPGVRRGHDAFRLVVASDRRLLAVRSPRSREPFVVIDVGYEYVSQFSVEWKVAGRLGVLHLTVAGADGAPSETHEIGYIAPANLLSIAEALQSQGVLAGDPAVVSLAQRTWEETRQGGGVRKRLFDLAAMNTPEFDRGLWLLLGLSAVAFYLNPFGVGLGASRSPELAVLLIPILCAVCGYVSRSRSSVAYLVPLNLLVAPAFFFAPAGYVAPLMLLLSTFAALGLRAGAALGEHMDAAADAAASPAPRAARGSLRYTLSGLGLLRLTGMLLGAMLALVTAASAAGYELTSLRLAVDERTLQQVPVDGRSNLTGGAASLTYTTGADLHEFITDNMSDVQQSDGARWELRSSWTKGFNVVSLAHYVFEPRLENPAAVAEFVARKDREHSGLAGVSVTHTERVVRGRKGYVWSHGSRYGYWYYAAWFPQPVHTVRVECIAKNQEERFRGLCSEAVESLRFRR